MAQEWVLVFWVWGNIATPPTPVVIDRMTETSCRLMAEAIKLEAPSARTVCSPR